MKTLPKPVWDKLTRYITANLSLRQKQYILKDADDPENDVQTALEALSYLCMQYSNLSSGNYDFHEVTTIVNEAVVKAGLHWHLVDGCDLADATPDFASYIQLKQSV